MERESFTGMGSICECWSGTDSVRPPPSLLRRALVYTTLAHCSRRMLGSS